MHIAGDDDYDTECKRNGHFVPIEDGELTEFRLCQPCAGEHDNTLNYPELNENILEAVESEWKSVTELADEFDKAHTSIRRRLEELHQVGKLNRRGGLADTDGSKGYEYSQQSIPKASYEENTNLFESMLNGD